MDTLQVLMGSVILGETLVIIPMVRYPGPRLLKRLKQTHPEEFKDA